MVMPNEGTPESSQALSVITRVIAAPAYTPLSLAQFEKLGQGTAIHMEGIEYPTYRPGAGLESASGSLWESPEITARSRNGISQGKDESEDDLEPEDPTEEEEKC
jgi:hypothetical protein